MFNKASRTMMFNKDSEVITIVLGSDVDEEDSGATDASCAVIRYFLTTFQLVTLCGIEPDI